MNWQKVISVLIFLLLTCSVFSQQIWPVQVTGALIPPRSLDLGVYGTDRSGDLFFNAMLNDPVEPTLQVQLQLSVEQNGQVIYQTDPNYFGAPITLAQFQMMQIDGNMLQNYLNSANLSGQNGSGIGSLEIPEGFNKICLQVFGVEKNVPVSNKFCVQGSFQLNQAPQIIMPSCAQKMEYPETQNQLFTWQAMHLGSSNSPGAVEYQFEMVQLPDGTYNANDAFESALQVYKTKTMSPTLLYTQAEPLLLPGKVYAWRVKASSLAYPTSKLFQNDGYSEVCTFMYYENDLPGTDISSFNNPAPMGCEVFNTDFGPISNTEPISVPLVESDKVALGYFTMEIIEASGGVQGFRGKGKIQVPMLNSYINVEFEGLKVNSDNRVYEVGKVSAIIDHAYKLDEIQLRKDNVTTRVNDSYVNELDNFFNTGIGTTRLVSGMNLSTNVGSNLPVAFDKQGQPMIAVIGMHFTPTNAFLNLVSWNLTDSQSPMRFAATALQATPHGVKNGSHLVFLNKNSQELSSPITNAFQLAYTGDLSSQMNCDCEGYKDLDMESDLQVVKTVLQRNDNSEAVVLNLENENIDKATYVGTVNELPAFKITGIEEMVFNTNGGQLDLKNDQTIITPNPSSEYQLPTTNEWRGLSLTNVSTNLPSDYNFMGSTPIGLNADNLFIDEQNVAYGKFEGTNLVSIESGKVERWAYSVDTLSLKIIDNAKEEPRLAGQIKTPVFTETFKYAGSLEKVANANPQMDLSIPSGTYEVPLWKGQWEMNENSSAQLEVKEVNNEKSFYPKGQFSGVLSINMENDYVIGKLHKGNGQNSAQLAANIKEQLGVDNLALNIENLELNNLAVDPFAEIGERYTLGSGANATVSIGGNPYEFGSVELIHNVLEDNQDELGLKFHLTDGDKDVTMTIWGNTLTNNTFKHSSVNIEMDTDPVDCQCKDQANTDPTIGDGNPSWPSNLGANEIYIPWLDIKLNSTNSTAQTTVSQNNKLRFGITKEENKLPINISTAEDMAKLGMTGEAFSEEDDHQLFITGFKVTEGSPNNWTKAEMELSIVYKVYMRSTPEDYLVFQKAKIQVTPSMVDLTNTYMNLVKDLSVTDPENNTFVYQKNDAGSTPDPEINTYAFLSCEGLVTYNVQAKYIAPYNEQSYTQSKLVARPKRPETSSTDFKKHGQAEFSFVIQTKVQDDDSQNSLTNFIAPLRKDVNGSKWRFSVEGAEQLVFVPGDEFTNIPYEAYIDYSQIRKVSEDTKQDVFKGLVFKQFAFEMPGFYGNYNGADTTLVDTLQNFYYSMAANSGMEGSYDEDNVVLMNSEEEAKQAELAGWHYGISNLNFTFNANQLKEEKVNVTGKIAIPIFDETPPAKHFTSGIIDFDGSVSFDKTKYEPKANFQSVDLSGKVFHAAMLPLIGLNLETGTLELVYDSATREFEGECEFAGKAGIFITSEVVDAVFGEDIPEGIGGLEVVLNLFTFKDLSINKGSSTCTGDQVYKGIKSFCGGIWGAGKRRNADFPDVGIRDLYDNGVNGFPVSINQPSLCASSLSTASGCETELKFGFVVDINFMNDKVNDSGDDDASTSPQPASEKASTSGLKATAKFSIVNTFSNANGLGDASIQLNCIQIEGEFGPAKISGGLNILRENAAGNSQWGSGFKAFLDIMLFDELGVVANGQFASTTQDLDLDKSDENTQVFKDFIPEGKTEPEAYRYFFLDFEGTLESGFAIPPSAPVLAIYGIGGGFRYNMMLPAAASIFSDPESDDEVGESKLSDENAIAKAAASSATDACNCGGQDNDDCKEIPDDVNSLLTPGMGITGKTYYPSEGVYGGYASLIAGLPKPPGAPPTVVGDVMIDMQISKKNGESLTFESILIEGNAYFLPNSVHDRRVESTAQAYASLRFDWRPKLLTGKVGVKGRFPNAENAFIAIPGSLEALGATDPKDINEPHSKPTPTGFASASDLKSGPPASSKPPKKRLPTGFAEGTFQISFGDEKKFGAKLGSWGSESTSTLSPLSIALKIPGVSGRSNPAPEVVDPSQTEPEPETTKTPSLNGGLLFELYAQVGHDVDGFPTALQSLPELSNFDDFKGSSNKAPAGMNKGNGLILGSRLTFDVKADLGPLHAALFAKIGFDLGLINYGDIECHVDEDGDGTIQEDEIRQGIGFHGWYAQANAFAYMDAKLKLKYNFAFASGEVNILDMTAAMMLQAKFPNPCYFRGDVLAKYDLLGGLVKGQVHHKAIFGEKCDNMDTPSPIADLPIFAASFPGNGEKEVNIFSDIRIATNMPLDQELKFQRDIDPDNDHATVESRAGLDAFKPTLENDGFRVYDLGEYTDDKQKVIPDGDVALPANKLVPGVTAYNDDRYGVHLSFSDYLKPLHRYAIVYTFKFEDNKNDEREWRTTRIQKKKEKDTDPTEFIDAIESDTLFFVTGEFPDVINTAMIESQAPGYRQRFWHDGYAEPKLRFKRNVVEGVSEHIFLKETTIKGQKVPFEYVIELTKYNDKGVQVDIEEITVDKHPSSGTLTKSVITETPINGTYKIPVVKVETVPVSEVSFPDFKEVDLSGQKGKMCKIRLIRRPNIENLAATTETEASLALEDKDATFVLGDQYHTKVSYMKKGLDEELLKEVVDSTKIIYEYHFAVSQYDQLYDKLKEKQAKYVSSEILRNDFNHPDEDILTAEQLLKSEEHATKDAYFILTTGDYGDEKYAPNEKRREGFDKFDLARIRQNTKISYQNQYGPALTIQNRYMHNGKATGMHPSLIQYLDNLRANKPQLSNYLRLVLKESSAFERHRDGTTDGTGWNYNFYLPENDTNKDNFYGRELSDAEINNNKLFHQLYPVNKYWKRTTRQDGSYLEPVFREGQSFDLIFQDLRSRIVLNQMRWLSHIGSQFDQAYGLTPRNRVSDFAKWHLDNYPQGEFFKFGAINDPYGGGNDYSWIIPVNLDEASRKFAFIADETGHRYSYHGTTTIEFPKKETWEEMDEYIPNLDAYDKVAFLLKPDRTRQAEDAQMTSGIVRSDRWYYFITDADKTIYRNGGNTENDFFKKWSFNKFQEGNTIKHQAIFAPFDKYLGKNAFRFKNNADGKVGETKLDVISIDNTDLFSLKGSGFSFPGSYSNSEHNDFLPANLGTGIKIIEIADPVKQNVRYRIIPKKKGDWDDWDEPWYVNDAGKIWRAESAGSASEFEFVKVGLYWKILHVTENTKKELVYNGNLDWEDYTSRININHLWDISTVSNGRGRGNTEVVIRSAKVKLVSGGHYLSKFITKYGGGYVNYNPVSTRSTSLNNCKFLLDIIDEDLELLKGKTDVIEEVVTEGQFYRILIDGNGGVLDQDISLTGGDPGIESQLWQFIKIGEKEGSKPIYKIKNKKTNKILAAKTEGNELIELDDASTVDPNAKWLINIDFPESTKRLALAERYNKYLGFDKDNCSVSLTDYSADDHVTFIHQERTDYNFDSYALENVFAGKSYRIIKEGHNVFYNDDFYYGRFSDNERTKGSKRQRWTIKVSPGSCPSDPLYEIYNEKFSDHNYFSDGYVVEPVHIRKNEEKEGDFYILTEKNTSRVYTYEQEVQLIHKPDSELEFNTPDYSAANLFRLYFSRSEKYLTIDGEKAVANYFENDSEQQKWKLIANGGSSSNFNLVNLSTNKLMKQNGENLVMDDFNASNSSNQNAIWVVEVVDAAKEVIRIKNKSTGKYLSGELNELCQPSLTNEISEALNIIRFSFKEFSDSNISKRYKSSSNIYKQPGFRDFSGIKAKDNSYFLTFKADYDGSIEGDYEILYQQAGRYIRGTIIFTAPNTCGNQFIVGCLNDTGERLHCVSPYTTEKFPSSARWEVIKLPEEGENCFAFKNLATGKYLKAPSWPDYVITTAETQSDQTVIQIFNDREEINKVICGLFNPNYWYNISPQKYHIKGGEMGMESLDSYKFDQDMNFKSQRSHDWKILKTVSATGTYYKLKIEKEPDKCLTITPAQNNQYNLSLETCTDSDNQNWIIKGEGEWYKISSAAYPLFYLEPTKEADTENPYNKYQKENADLEGMPLRIKRMKRNGRYEYQ